jgi:hypothetical protein
MSEVIQRHDRDGNLISRVYKRAERRRRADQREQNAQRLRDRIGVIERPPRTFRERCLGVEEEEPPSFDFARELRKRLEERERSRKVRH